MDCERDVLLTGAAARHTGPIGEVERLGGNAAARADEAAIPAGALKISRACRVVRKEPLKLRQGAREGQAFALEHFRGHGLTVRNTDGGTACAILKRIARVA